MTGGKNPGESEGGSGQPAGTLKQIMLAKRLLAGSAEGGMSIPDVSSCLADEDETTRELAVLVLEQAGASAVAPLTAATQDSQPAGVRIAAVAALGRIGPPAGTAAEPLCRYLEGDDDQLREHAALALGQIGIDALPPLIVQLGSADSRVQTAALNAIGYMGKDAGTAVEAVSGLCQAESLPLRLAACSVLVRISADPSQGLPVLLAAMEHEDGAIRKESVERIGELRDLAVEALPALRNCLGDREAAVRAATALTLARIPGGAAQTIALLTALLDDSDPDVIVNACMALATAGPEAAAALPRLQTLRNDPDQRTAGLAAAAIERIGSTTA
jgi:HEAT repeat protein